MSSSDESTAGSVSRLECTAAIRGKGESKVSVFRHLSPLTVNALLRELPLQGRVTVQPAMVTTFTNLKVGVEKPRLSFERGDVAFLPSGGLLCFFLKPAKSDRPLNLVGKLESGAELFDTARPGDVVTISKAASA